MNNKRILEIREEEHIVKMKRMETMPTAPKQPSKITQIVERGHIFFFYRPTTIEIDCDTKKDWFKQDHAINCIEDVSRFYMLLKPDPSMSAKAKNRLLTMTAKQMPRLDCHDMKGALVSLASDDLEEITQYLHGTVSWEGLIVPPARPCGEGIYELVRHGFSGPLHFIYELELPEKIGGPN